MDQEDANFPHEEFAFLLGTAIPGTARQIHRSTVACNSQLEIAAADLLLDARPSGVVLPKILRRKLRLLNRMKIGEADDFDGDNKPAEKLSDAINKKIEYTFRALNSMAAVPLYDRVAHFDAKRLHSKSPIAQTQSNFEQAIENDKDDIKYHLPRNYKVPDSYKHIDQSRVFTCTELERKLSKANAALIDIQKQILRGEEIYFQDTDAHGNIYKGWESFIDAKPEQLGIQDVDCILSDEYSSLGPTTVSSAPSRKMHPDLRWFSSSSYSVEQGTIRKVDRKKKLTPTSPVPTRNTSPKPNRSPVTEGQTDDVLSEILPDSVTSKDTEDHNPIQNVSVKMEEVNESECMSSEGIIQNDNKSDEKNHATENCDSKTSGREGDAYSTTNIDVQIEETQPKKNEVLSENSLQSYGETERSFEDNTEIKCESNALTTCTDEGREVNSDPINHHDMVQQEIGLKKRKHDDVDDSSEEHSCSESLDKSSEVRSSSRLRKRTKN